MQSSTSIVSSAEKVPRPLNCFMIYRLEKQSEIVAECPGANHRDISKIIAKWWKEMTEEEKEPYRLQAEMARENHRILYPDYKYFPQKKKKKTRTYKKRPQNEFTAVAHEKRKKLLSIYRRGKYEDDEQSETSTSPNITSISSMTEKRRIHCFHSQLSEQHSILNSHPSENEQFELDSSNSQCDPFAYSTYQTTYNRNSLHENINDDLSDNQVIYTNASGYDNYVHNRWNSSFEDYRDPSIYLGLSQNFHSINPFLVYPFY